MAQTTLEKTDPTISTIAKLLGARGGKVRSEKKLQAVRKNMKKAQAKRWPQQKSN